MSLPEARDVAGGINRVRRRTAPHRPGAVVLDLPGQSRGWLSVKPGEPAGENPSAGAHRLCWYAPARPLGADDVAVAADELTRLGCEAAYAWIAPWAVSPGFEGAFARAGAVRWPHVEYVVLCRGVSPVPADRSCIYPIRRVEPAEAARVLAMIDPWYFPGGAASLTAQVLARVGEVYAAFDGDRPVGVGFVEVVEEWGYLGAAGTHPDHRGRGIQTALIGARVARAARRGARWCVAETNTVVTTSLRNMERCGFAVALAWRVYRWDLGRR